MDFKEYQKKAYKTFLRNKYNSSDTELARLSLGIVGEAGELAEKVKKYLRGDYGCYISPFKKDVKKELGDILWYISVFSKFLFYNYNLDKIAEENIKKLDSRKKRNKLKGSGDSR